MNERINNLIDQSGFGSYAEIPDTYIVHKNDLVEFAELIVKECMEQVWYTREDGINGNISEVIKDRIKQHFGVEE
jgi:hypothetical protein